MYTMTTSPDNQYDAKTQSIIDTFVEDGMGMSKDAATAINPMSLSDYRELNKLLLENQNPLPDSLLEERVRYIYEDSKLKYHFKSGYRICPVVLPFSNMGEPFTSREIQDGAHLRLLIVDEHGNTLAGFGNDVCKTFDMLPPEVQALAFTVGPYSTENPHIITPEDRTKIAEQYIASFRKLQQLLAA